MLLFDGHLNNHLLFENSTQTKQKTVQVYVTKEFLADYKDPFGRWWAGMIIIEAQATCRRYSLDDGGTE